MRVSRSYSVEVYHNILWSKYKGAIFSELYRISPGLVKCFVHIAETDGAQSALGQVDLRYHRYQYTVLYRGAYSAVPTLALCRTLYSEVWNSTAELVVLPGYDRVEFWVMLAAAILRRKRRAVFCDSTIHDRRQVVFKGLLKRLFFKMCDGFFAYGERAREYLVHYGAPQSRVFQRCQAAALPTGYSAEVALADRVTRAPVDRLRVLYVGRLSPEKSIDTLLNGFSLVCKVRPDAELVIVGAGPLGSALQQLAKELSIYERVTFAGSMDVDQLAIQYGMASCLVLPSTSEPWGLVVNEALSYGCPVVVSRVCGCVPELVLDGITGFVIEPGSAADVAAKLLRVPHEFGDAAKTAQSCLRLIESFSPAAAAAQIIRGCDAIMEV